jgi:murein DD-endopeptidase MepM/ murein hydrolase activator NlpD
VALVRQEDGTFAADGTCPADGTSPALPERGRDQRPGRGQDLKAWSGSGGLRTDAAVVVVASVLGTFLVVALRAQPAHHLSARVPTAAVGPPETTAAIVAASEASAVDAGVVMVDSGTVAALPDAPASPPRPPVWRIASLSNDSSVAYTEGVVGKRPLAVALGAAGLPRAEVQRVLHAFTGVKNLNHTSPKDTFAFARDKPAGHVVAFEYSTSPEDVWQARDESGGALQADKLDLLVEEKQDEVGVLLGEDLRASVVAAGLDDDIVNLIDDALDGRAERSDLRAGARLRIVATEERIESRFSRYSRLDAVEYTPADADAQPLRVYYFHHPSGETERSPDARRGGVYGGGIKGGGFFDAKGQQPYHGGWRTPVPLARIASRFNPQRMHPVLHVIMPHNGVDFAAPVGTPIYASASGIVKSAGDSGPCGNMVQIDHPGGLTSAYCHMSRFAAGLHVGQHVEARQLIGYVGQTGRATGPHLHFAIKRGDVYIDPLALKLDGLRVVPLIYRDEFAKVRAGADALLDAIPLPHPAPAPPAAEDKGKKSDDTVFDDSPGL